jgi:outer membrane lipoprotein-sorting protein
VELTEVSGAGMTIWIDSATGLATRQALIGDDGLVEADITYLEHAIEAGAAVPIAIEIVSPRMGTKATLRIKRFEINARPPDGAFEFSPPAGVGVFHLDDNISPGVSR